jgi:hypothetical protein
MSRAVAAVSFHAWYAERAFHAAPSACGVYRMADRSLPVALDSSNQRSVLCEAGAMVTRERGMLDSEIENEHEPFRHE